MSDRIELLKKFSKEAEGGWVNWLERAKTAYNFIKGGKHQWDSADLKLLTDAKKPALTFNKIKPIIRTLSGWQRQNRYDQRVLARRDGVELLAQVYTELLKYFYDMSRADWEISHNYVDGVVTGKGWISLDIDYTRDPLNGDLLLKRENPLMILEDPTSQRYDLSDARYIIRQYWMAKEQIEREFPESKGDLVPGLTAISALEKQTSEETNIEEARYLVQEYYWREYEQKKLLINMKTLEVSDVSAEEEERVAKIIKSVKDEAGVPILRLARRVMPILNLSTRVGDVILQDIKDPFDGIFSFPLIRFCSDWINGYVKGEVEDLIDPQKEENKRRSQALHILNTSPSSGIIYTDGAFSPEEERKLKMVGTTSGLALKANEGFGLGKGIWRIEPARLSEGHITLAKLSEDDLKKISGVNSDLLGYAPEKQESGIAMRYRKEAGLLTIESVLDNFNYSQRILGETLLEFIRKTDVISKEEITAIVEDKNIEGLDPETLKKLLSRRAIGKYSVVLATQPSSPTAKLAQFYTLVEAAKSGVIPVPPELLVEYSDLPPKAKERITEEIRRMKEISPPAGGTGGRPGLTR